MVLTAEEFYFGALYFSGNVILFPQKTDPYDQLTQSQVHV